MKATKMRQTPTTSARAKNILFSFNVLLLFLSHTLTHSLTLTFSPPPIALSLLTAVGLCRRSYTWNIGLDQKLTQLHPSRTRGESRRQGTLTKSYYVKAF